MKSITNVIIFGAGEGGQKIFSILPEYVHVVCFLDNDEKKYNREFLSHKIYSPNKINELDYDFILIASMFSHEIVPQLQYLGIDNKNIIICPPLFLSGSNIAAEYNKDEFIVYLIECLNGNNLITDDSFKLIKHYMTCLSKSNLFDKEFFIKTNRGLIKSRVPPEQFFCRWAWRKLKNPSRDIDLIWYKHKYMSENSSERNPLTHYVEKGMHRGYLPRPKNGTQNRIGTGVKYNKKSNDKVLRICLFAGYDVDGIIDDYVVSYIRELSLHSDVYYLTDCELIPGELEKLNEIVKGAWGIRHKKYDFGSYAILANELVGWSIIEKYDELLLVNDSSYCVQSLKHVFEKMHDHQCDFWGMNLTKGMRSTLNSPTNQFKDPIHVTKVKSEFLNKFENDDVYDFHISSYFLAFRKSVLKNKRFKSVISNASKNFVDKELLIREYEIGLTRFLINEGYELDSFIDYLYPYHPVYSTKNFDLIADGFPLLKKTLLLNNPLKEKFLLKSMETLRGIITDEFYNPIIKNLKRTGNQENIYNHMRINHVGDSPLNDLYSNDEFFEVDKVVCKNDNWWVFPVCAFNHTLSGNLRSIYEAVKDDLSIKKIILYRSRSVDYDGKNVEYVPLISRVGQELLMRSRVIFIKHSINVNIGFRIDLNDRYIINLWHGIPLKRICYASIDHQHELDTVYKENARSDFVISSSEIDRMAMACGFYPLDYNQVWLTGLPSNDLIIKADNELPIHILKKIEWLKNTLSGKRIILFAPTFRKINLRDEFRFSQLEKEILINFMEDNNLVFAVRKHIAQRDYSYLDDLLDLGALNLNDRLFPDIEAIYHCADILVTDYSSVIFDFILIKKPIVSFSYDIDDYKENQRGFFYEFDMFFPGKICFDFQGLIESLKSSLLPMEKETSDKYDIAKRMFFKYDDGRNSERVVSRLKELFKG